MKLKSGLLFVFLVLPFSCSNEQEVVPVTNVLLNSMFVDLVEGETFTLMATVSPYNASNKRVLWTTDNAKVASVDKGVIKALSAGRATITATTDDGAKKATCSVTVNSKGIRVSEVSLDVTELTLQAGDSTALTATVFPENASNKKIGWHSSDEEVATVSPTGMVYAHKAGSSVISATAEDGGHEARCSLLVVIAVSGLSLDVEELVLEKGESETITATVLPVDATDKEVLWASSDESVATVEAGLITGVGSGTATITATTADGGKTATCNVRVIISIQELSLEPSSLTMKVGETTPLVLTISPMDATETTIIWSSSFPSVASVNEGVVRALKSGTTQIKALSENNVYAVCDVTVVVPVAGISVSPQNLVLEQNTSESITATILPSNATNKQVVWNSADASVASVSNGIVTGLKPGTTQVTATSVDGNYSASCSITVEKEKTKATSLSFDGTSLYVGAGQSYTLEVRVTPNDAVCNYVWSSSNTGAVSVSGNGNNSATVSSNYSSSGYTTVTVTEKRSGRTTSIKVYSYIQSFSWQESTGETYSGFPMITLAKGGTHKLSYSSGAGSNVLNLFGNLSDFVFYEPSSIVSTPANISISSDGVVTGLKVGTTGIKATGTIQGSSDRVYFKVVSQLNESEYNDSQNNSNQVLYGLPMYFSLGNSSDVDWFKLLPKTDAAGNVSVTISVDYPGASSLAANESRLCKYSLYDASLQQWGAGSFMFSKAEQTSSTTRTVPNGPLYLKVYFDSSSNASLRPSGTMVLKMVVN